jgi:hypothetical protein
MATAFFIVVVMKPIVFKAYFSCDSPTELINFPGFDVCIKRHSQEAKLFHWGVGITFLINGK